MSTCCDFTAAIHATGFPLTDSWNTRGLANGAGGPLAGSTLNAVRTFERAITNATGLLAQLKCLNIFLPADRVFGLTPFINTIGALDPWTQNGFAIQSITACGYANDGVPVDCTLHTGVFTNKFAFGHLGVEAYWNEAASASATSEIGCTDGVIGVGSSYIFNFGYTGNLCAAAMGEAGVFGTGMHSGYLSFERTGVAQADFYYLNSGQPVLTSQGTNPGLATDGRNGTRDFYVFDYNNSGAPSADHSNKRFGMVCFSSGLSAADSQTFGTAVQALWTALGCSQ